MIRRVGVAVLVVACGSSTEPAKPNVVASQPTPSDATAVVLRTGTWRIPVDARRRERPGVVELPGTTRFAFDGTSVVLELFTAKAWMWKTADDHYRLKARWVGDELQYLPPFGDWSALATWQRDHYEQPGTTAPWRYELVTDAMKDADDRVLDAPRGLHDYTIKPMDRRP